jgi:hypothetical protein
LLALAILLSICLIVSDFGTRALDVPSVQIGKAIVRRLGLDKGVSGRKEIDAEEATLPEHSGHVAVLS